jgi:hypothetical protein
MINFGILLLKKSKWTKEDWQFVDENKKGRYLPKKIIDSLMRIRLMEEV